ncbi:uncharacterized protein LOC110454865 [Mizuhopecten yessoensis]|uniref:uncharacterized protein LOC110454865 n=1 Tax=Mizuhopecten yessoensis TaxID=6573 RepID=UPI000B45C52A|nr:uncharacterized protein LOC110454865 [Mizuhopecten yessoensis]
MERILIGLCVFLSGAIFAVEGSVFAGTASKRLCNIGKQMNGVWIGVLDHMDTHDWIVIMKSNTIHVNVRDAEATYVCKGENQYGSTSLWMTENGSKYLCVYRAIMMDSVVQYSLSTNTGEFAPKDLPGRGGHTIEHLCGNARRRPALDIRRSYEHQLHA